MSEKPNLFNYATSELSQDAFLAWLIKYADEENAKDTSGAHQAGRRFLDLAFERNDRQKLVGDLKIDVERQHCHIDVYAKIEELSTKRKFVLVLEDKAGTTEHDNQLARYREVAHAENYEDSQLVCVYCQTHNEDEKKSISQAGYCCLNRQDLLGVLPSQSDNLILQSFVDHLNKLEDLTNEWQNVPPHDSIGRERWKWHAWQGFFMKLRKELGDGAWAYVPNPSGGFLGFWWHWKKIDGGSLYLQLEEGKACFKVEVDENVDAGEMKWAWNTLVIEKATELGVDAIKPKVMRKGMWMTVAILKDDYRRVDSEGHLDLDATMQVIGDMMRVVDKVPSVEKTRPANEA